MGETVTPESTREKSVMLAKAMGWAMVQVTPRILRFHPLDIDSYDAVDNLYDPANMALAWRVLNWAEAFLPIAQAKELVEWWYEDDQLLALDNMALIQSTPAEAQAAWLDKVLELAIEAGLLERAP